MRLRPAGMKVSASPMESERGEVIVVLRLEHPDFPGGLLEMGVSVPTWRAINETVCTAFERGALALLQQHVDHATAQTKGQPS